jgi:hypothetical protein
MAEIVIFLAVSTSESGSILAFHTLLPCKAAARRIFWLRMPA